MLFDAHGDDLENGEGDRCCHGGWELQHGRGFGSESATLDKGTDLNFS